MNSSSSFMMDIVMGISLDAVESINERIELRCILLILCDPSRKWGNLSVGESSMRSDRCDNMAFSDDEELMERVTPRHCRVRCSCGSGRNT